jgi:hypothetical protein
VYKTHLQAVLKDTTKPGNLKAKNDIRERRCNEEKLTLGMAHAPSQDRDEMERYLTTGRVLSSISNCSTGWAILFVRRRSIRAVFIVILPLLFILQFVWQCYQSGRIGQPRYACESISSRSTQKYLYLSCQSQSRDTRRPIIGRTQMSIHSPQSFISCHHPVFAVTAKNATPSCRGSPSDHHRRAAAHCRSSRRPF